MFARLGTALEPDLWARVPFRDDGTSLAAHFAEVADGHCPYLQPALDAGTLWLSRYSIGPETASNETEVAEFVMFSGLRHVEWLRDVRRSLPAARAQRACDNAVFTASHTPNDQAFWERVVGWPHWLLKLLYSPVGVMVGKFWRNEVATSRYGLDLPRPPVTFISMRSAVRRRDPGFLHDTPLIAEQIATSDDDGRNVLAAAGLAADLSSFASFRKARWFDEARRWARSDAGAQQRSKGE